MSKLKVIFIYLFIQNEIEKFMRVCKRKKEIGWSLIFNSVGTFPIFVYCSRIYGFIKQ